MPFVCAQTKLIGTNITEFHTNSTYNSVERMRLNRYIQTGPFILHSQHCKRNNVTRNIVSTNFRRVFMRRHGSERRGFIRQSAEATIL